MRTDDSGTAIQGVVVRGALTNRTPSPVVLTASRRLVEVPMSSVLEIRGPADAVEVVLRRDAQLIVRGSGASPVSLIGSDVFGRPPPGGLMAAECYSACNCNCNCSSGGGNCNCNCNCSSGLRVGQFAERADQRPRFRQPLPPAG